MGYRSSWKCKNCDYTIDISAGKDRGFIMFTQTFQCNTCKVLIDVEVSESEWETERWENHYCEKCNHLLELWDTKKKFCPSCGVGRLKEASGEGFIIHWD